MSDLGEPKPNKRPRKTAAADPAGEAPAKPRKPRAKAAPKPAIEEAAPASFTAMPEIDDVFREEDAFAQSVAETLSEPADLTPADEEPETDLATLLAQFGKSDATRIELAPVLDRNAAVALHGGFMAARNGPIEIDASKVERLGGQCAQILLSAVATWAADAQPLSLLDPSVGFERDCKLLGLGMHDFQPMDPTQ